jgi:hypothetical protein
MNIRIMTDRTEATCTSKRSVIATIAIAAITACTDRPVHATGDESDTTSSPITTTDGPGSATPSSASDPSTDPTSAVTDASATISSADATSDEGTSTKPDPDTGDATSSSDSDDGLPPTCERPSDCDNGELCDGEESCINGECVAGPPLACGPDEICHPTLGCTSACTPVSCYATQWYSACGNCEDDDGDGLVDGADPGCWGPCDDSEIVWGGYFVGQPPDPCVVADCYFDNNWGHGNDECYWALACDPLAPNGCEHEPTYDPPGPGGPCAELDAQQSQWCLDTCAPVTPNGCDCFGCCEIALPNGEAVTVFLGSYDDDAFGFTCGAESVDDPTLCHPCTQVQSCKNPCEPCELCFGTLELDAACPEQACPSGAQPCGLPGQPGCPIDHACVTGCCLPTQ